ncbi:hypothetical protein [Legionella nagasakiensis]|uniref:hypothetical protein n=1 Tax=Legionella nagasakiensis TaxID=535290 RepID=UPI001054961B|nr:hypothetical protein [Legionella nagasakiensis]
MLSNIINIIVSLIKNPKVYVATIAGIIPGAFTAGVIGALSGVFIGNGFAICANCTDSLLGHNINITLAGLIGLIIGVVLGGIVAGGFIIYKIYKETINPSQLVSHENIMEVLSAAFSIGAKISLGMGCGAIIGSLKLLGIGTVLGGGMGALCMLIFFIVTKKAYFL